jgi:hypothetical protein
MSDLRTIQALTRSAQQGGCCNGCGGRRVVAGGQCCCTGCSCLELEGSEHTAMGAAPAPATAAATAATAPPQLQQQQLQQQQSRTAEGSDGGPDQLHQGRWRWSLPTRPPSCRITPCTGRSRRSSVTRGVTHDDISSSASGPLSPRALVSAVLGAVAAAGYNNNNTQAGAAATGAVATGAVGTTTADATSAAVHGSSEHHHHHHQQQQQQQQADDGFSLKLVAPAAATPVFLKGLAAATVEGGDAGSQPQPCGREINAPSRGVLPQLTAGIIGGAGSGEAAANQLEALLSPVASCAAQDAQQQQQQQPLPSDAPAVCCLPRSSVPLSGGGTTGADVDGTVSVLACLQLVAQQPSETTLQLLQELQWGCTSPDDESVDNARGLEGSDGAASCGVCLDALPTASIVPCRHTICGERLSVPLHLAVHCFV